MAQTEKHLLPESVIRQVLDGAGEACRQQAESFEANGWYFSRAPKGRNGIVFHVRHDDGYDLALKISKRDERDRAGREYAATKALREAGFDICPRPLHLERDPVNLPGDALISEWLPGDVLIKKGLPDDQTGWRAILEAMSRAHRLTPETSPTPLRNAIMDVRQPEDLVGYIEGWLERLPAVMIGTLHYDQLKQLAARVREVTAPRWERPARIGLIQCDANPGNMIEYDGKIWLVDWEISGWSDPALDLADLLTKPNVLDAVSEDRRVWLRAEHRRLLNDDALAERSAMYERLFIAWWVMRTSGYLVEASDHRLAGVRPIVPAEMMARQESIWRRACELFGL